MQRAGAACFAPAFCRVKVRNVLCRESFGSSRSANPTSPHGYYNLQYLRKAPGRVMRPGAFALYDRRYEKFSGDRYGQVADGNRRNFIHINRRVKRKIKGSVSVISGSAKRSKRFLLSIFVMNGQKFFHSGLSFAIRSVGDFQSSGKGR